MTNPPLSHHYAETRNQVSNLLSNCTAEQLATAVPACPGWTVRDVAGHLAAIPGDVAEGRLTSVPDDAFTAAQVARTAELTTSELLDLWATTSPALEEIIDAVTLWPAVIDAVSHLQDIRGALGTPGDRDTAALVASAHALLQFEPPVPLAVTLNDGTTVAVGESGSGGEPLGLRTTRWEVVRFRMGRRSRAQLSALAWDGDPSPVLDHLVVMGPATVDVVE
jgi:uncharacterized protein (TIGR03083 family)